MSQDVLPCLKFVFSIVWFVIGEMDKSLYVFIIIIIIIIIITIIIIIIIIIIITAVFAAINQHYLHWIELIYKICD